MCFFQFWDRKVTWSEVSQVLKGYSLWSEIIATLLSILKIFLGEFENRKKVHRPFLYIERVLSVSTLNV